MKIIIYFFFERTGKWIAYILIIFGILILWSYSRQKKDIKEMIQSVAPYQKH